VKRWPDFNENGNLPPVSIKLLWLKSLIILAKVHLSVRLWPGAWNTSILSLPEQAFSPLHYIWLVYHYKT
jgi:hypothetical protein